MKPLVRIAGIAAALVCGGYFVAVGIEHVDQLPALQLSGAAVLGLALATLLFVLTMAIGGVAWHVALRAAGETANLRAALAAVMLSQIAKYVPGNVAHVMGRGVLGHRFGLALPRIVVAMTFETGWTIVTAMLVAAIAIAIEGPALSGTLPPLSPGWIAAVLVAALAAPAVGAWVLGRWRPGWLARLIGDADVRLPGVAPTVACVALYAVSFGLAGVALDRLAIDVLGAAESRLVLLTGVFAVAWVAGYVTPGAPGGLGVREAIMVAALGPVYDPGTATALALVLRACTFAADGFGFLAGLAIRPSSLKAERLSASHEDIGSRSRGESRSAANGRSGPPPTS